MQVLNLSNWQTEVIHDSHRFKVLCIGRRSGKTLLSCIEMLRKASEPKTKVWYISPTYKQSKLIAWAMLKDLTRDMVQVRYNEQELAIHIIDRDSVIYLKGADNPDSLRGTHIDFCVMDEVAFFTDWPIVWQSLRPIIIDSKANVWFISTPNGFNHFYDLYKKQADDADYVSYHFTSYDNPYIDSKEIDKAKQEMTEDQFIQEFMAEFNKPSGAVYKDWPIDNFRPTPYDHRLPLHISMDFGINDPTSIIWIQPEGSEFRIVDYYEASNADIGHFIAHIRSKPYREPELYTGDEAGRARDLTTGLSPIDVMESKGMPFRTMAGLKIEEQIREAHKHMKYLYVDNKLERLRDCFINYRYPTKRSNIINQSNEKPIHDQYSHAMRALEYYFVNYRGLDLQESRNYKYDAKKWSI